MADIPEPGIPITGGTTVLAPPATGGNPPAADDAPDTDKLASPPLIGEFRWSDVHTAALVAIVIAIMVIGWRTPATLRMWSWLATLGLLTLFALVAGHGVTGWWQGLLIDERNKLSLTRLQLALWTVVVLSALLTASLSNIALQDSEPLSISLPEELWLLMGISTTSLVGTPLIRSTKRSQAASDEEQSRTYQLLARQNVDPATVKADGQVLVNVGPEHARFLDLFKGEEVGNAAHLDLGKMQLFYFTLIMVLAYGAALASLFASTAEAVHAFPALDQSMVALLGISHSGYLLSQVIPNTKSS